jgi:hypothetical protein
MAALAILPTAAHAGWIDYAQADTSSSATTVVLVGAVGATDTPRPAPLVSATYTRWSTGAAGGIGYVQRWAVGGDTHHWVIGAGAGANAFHSRDASDENKAALSARAQSEWFGPAPGGSYYALAQASSFRRSWLAAAQYSPAGAPVALEWARYHERGYQASSAGLRIATGVPRWYVRLGATHANAETRGYLGIAYNGF